MIKVVLESLAWAVISGPYLGNHMLKKKATAEAAASLPVPIPTQNVLSENMST